jgi:hypothetical protein
MLVGSSGVNFHTLEVSDLALDLLPLIFTHEKA